MDILSLAVGIMSIILAVYSIWYAHKESKQSEENYEKTKVLLDEINRSSHLINQAVANHQLQLVMIINRMLDKVGAEQITQEELDKIASQFAEINKKVDNQPKIHINEPLGSKGKGLYFIRK